MQNSEKQNKDVKNDPYLESPKVFHLEMPLYHNLDISITDTEDKIKKLLNYNGAIDAYCIHCKKESVFKAVAYKGEGLFNADYNLPVTYYSIPYGLTTIAYRCTRNKLHLYHTYYFRKGDLFIKVGQFPSVADFQIPQAEKYRKILSEDQYKELTRGIGLSAHGVGIGSFVYLRRVFEKLIEEAHKQAELEIKNFSNDDYSKARMNEKIEMLKDYLPAFLVENRDLYSIMSKGIHELSEDECLQYFETVKIGIEQILDEKIIQKEKAEKAVKASEEIQKVRGRISKS